MLTTESLLSNVGDRAVVTSSSLRSTTLRFQIRRRLFSVVSVRKWSGVSHWRGIGELGATKVGCDLLSSSSRDLGRVNVVSSLTSFLRPGSVC